MRSTTIRLGILTVVLTLCVGVARAQDPSPPQKKIPSMSSDDVGVRSPNPTTSPDDARPPAGTRDATLPPGWARYTPDGCGLSIGLPGPMEPLPVPNQTGFTIRSYAYKSSTMVVVVGHAVIPGHGTARDFAEGVMIGLQRAGGADMHYSIENADGPRLTLVGSYKQTGVPLAFEGFVEKQGQNCWMVLTVYSPANDQGSTLGKKALRSASFDAAPCEDR
jgi:hypothetical protein